MILSPEDGTLFEPATADAYAHALGGRVSVNVQYHYRSIFTGKLVAKFQVDVLHYRVLDFSLRDLFTNTMIECKYKQSGSCGIDEVIDVIEKKSKKHKNRYIVPADKYVLASSVDFSVPAQKLAHNME